MVLHCGAPYPERAAGESKGFRWATFVLGAALLLGFVQDEKAALTVRCFKEPRKPNQNLVLEGDADLPQGTVLKVTVYRLYEQREPGSGKLNCRLASDQFNKFPAVEKKKYRSEIHGTSDKGTALYRVTVETAMDGGKTKVEMDVPCWSDALVKDLDKHLAEFDALADECIKFIDALNEAAAKGKNSWTAAIGVLKQLDAHHKKMLKTEAYAVYPTAIDEILGAVGSILAIAPDFKFGPDGKLLDPENYYGKLKDSKQAEFSFPNQRKYVEEAFDVAGREFSLWYIKEFRRRGGLGGPISASLKAPHVAGHAGVLPWAARLESLTEADIAALEAEIRKLPLPDKTPEKPAETPPDKPKEK